MMRQSRAEAPLWEQGLVAMWVLVTTVSFPKDELFLYPLTLFFMASVYLRRAEIIPFMLKNWILFLLPIWTMSSYLWSPVGMQSMRYGVFSLLTVIIAVYMAKRLTIRQIVQAVFVANVVVIILVTPKMGTFDQGGPFGEKNIFAWRMAFAFLSATALALDPKEPRAMRLAAMPFIPVAYLYMFLAQSATAFVMSSAAVLVLILIWAFWTPASRVRHLRMIVIFVIAVLVLTGALLFALLPQNEIVASFLESLGKDTTLTGRTMLWHSGREVVKDHPWLGYGAEAYWQRDVGTAQTLLELSFKDPGMKFSFHNSYLETQVNLGLIGLGLLIVTVAWSLYRAVFGWLRHQDIKYSFLLLISLIMFMTSFTESVFYSTFDIGVTLFFIAAAAASFASKPEVILVPANPDSMQVPNEAQHPIQGYKAS